MKTNNTIWLLLFVCLACRTNEKPLSVEYEMALNRYFKEVHQTQFHNGDEVVLIPLSGCSPCIKDLLNHLSSELLDIKPIILGVSNDDDVINRADKLGKSYEVLWDKENRYYKYRTNLGGPTWLKYGKNGIEALKELETSSLQNILK